MFSILPPAIIFITIASATSFFPNSTTSRRSSSESTTSKQSKTSHSIISTSSSSPSSTSEPWQKSCLYDPGLGYGDCNRPGDPVWGGADNPYDTSMFPSNIVPPNPSLATFCGSMFSSAESLWLSTAAITSTTYPGYTNTDPEEGALTTDTSQEVEAYYNNFWTFTAQSPCCLNCTLFGGNVQVYYWPTPAPSPPVSTLVNAAGFTFISPSVYVAFQSLYATNLCGAVGPVYNSTTLSFAQDELMTAMAWSSNPDDNWLPWEPYIPDVFSTADWAEKKNCTNITSSYYQGDGSAEYPNWAAATSAVGTALSAIEMLNMWVITYNPCSPTLSVPTQLFTINSLWKGCMQGIDAFYDPPYPLSPGGTLSPFNPTPDPAVGGTAQPAKTTTASREEAAAGPTATPTTASSTTSRNQQSTSTTSDPTPKSSPPTVNNDPANNSPSSNDPVNTDSVNDHPSSNTPSPPNNEPPAQSPSAAGNDDSAQTSPSVANSSPAQSPSAEVNSDPAQSLPASNSPASIITIGSLTFTANSASAFVFGSQTLTPGGQAVVSGITYSLATNGGALAIGTSTTQFFTTPPAHAVSEYLVGTQTLLAGGPAITVSGIMISLQSGGQSVIVDGSTQTLSAAFPTSASEYLVGSQTLVAGGPAITVSGTVISLVSGGGAVVVGEITEPLSQFLASATSQSQGLGGIIASLGGFVTPAPAPVTTTGFVGYNGTVYTGGTSRCQQSAAFLGMLLGMGAIAVVL